MVAFEEISSRWEQGGLDRGMLPDLNPARSPRLQLPKGIRMIVYDLSYPELKFCVSLGRSLFFRHFVSEPAVLVKGDDPATRNIT